jgi:hypothetical protein
VAIAADGYSVEDVRKSHRKLKESSEAQIYTPVKINVEDNGKRYEVEFKMELNNNQKYDYTNIFSIHKVCAVLNLKLAVDPAFSKCKFSFKSNVHIFLSYSFIFNLSSRV